jgi:hypothetical protein
MDYMGYFEVEYFQRFYAVKKVLDGVGLQFSDSGFFYSEKDGQLVELKSDGVVELDAFERSVIAGEGKISEWFSEYIQLSLAFIGVAGKKYVLFVLSDNDFTILGCNLGGKEKLIEFFFDLYRALESDCGYLSSETDEYKMISSDLKSRNEFIKGVYLAINPKKEDIKMLNNICYFKHLSNMKIEYYERIPESLFA